MRRTELLGLFLLLLVLPGVGPAAAAERPFKSSVTATWDNIFNGLFAPPANFIGGGQVTHMGKTVQTGTLFLEFSPDGIFPGYGSVTITAANTDSLTFDYVGLLNSFTGEGTGTFIFTGGTGRFANATGGGTFYALIDLSFPEGQPMSVELNGKIDY